MPTITSFFITRKHLIIKLIWLTYFAFLAFFIYSIQSLSLHPSWENFGRKAGQVAAGLFVLAVTSGILKRFAVTGTLQQIQIILMTFRRQFGIGMYLFALMHSSWINNLTYFLNGQIPTPQTLQQLIGTIALYLTLPLFLTSNDFSQNKLGKYWDLLHKLVYLINWLIFAHIALIGKFNKVGALVGLVAILEIASFISSRNRQSQNQPQTSPSPQ